MVGVLWSRIWRHGVAWHPGRVASISLDGDDGGCYQLSSGSLDWTLRYSVAVVGALEEEAAWGMVDSSLDGGRTQGHCADHLEGERERE